MLYVACPCGRAIAVPDGHGAATITCPDCGRVVPLDGTAPATPPRAPRPFPSIRIAVSDIGCLLALAVLIVVVITVPGVGRALGVGILACCVAPALGFAAAGWWYLRRIRRMQQDAVDAWRERDATRGDDDDWPPPPLLG